MKYIIEEDKTYFKNLKIYIAVVASIFLLSTIVSAVYESYLQKDNIPQESNNYSNVLIDKQITIVYDGAYNKNNESIYFDSLNQFGQWFYITSANSFISFLQGSLGIFFGGFSLFCSANQGIFIGKMVYLMSERYGFLPIMSGLLPHGIIEIPAILITLAIGLRLGYKHIFMYLFVLNNLKIYSSFQSIAAFINTGMKEEISNGAIFYVKYIIPMLIISGFIEIFISGRIRNILFGI